MEINGNGLIASVLQKVSINNNINWTNILAIENKPINTTNTYFPLLKNKLSCLDLYKNKGIDIPDIIVNNAIFFKNISRNEFYNVPIYIFFINLGNRNNLDIFKNDKVAENYYFFERYVKIIPRYTCPPNLAKKIPLIVSTVFLIRKDLMIIKNRWNGEIEFDNIINTDNIFQNNVIYFNESIFVTYYDNVELLDNVRTYDDYETSKAREIILFLNSKKKIPTFIKLENDYDKFIYLSKLGLYPFSIKSIDELNEYYQKIVKLNSMSVEEYVKNYNLPSWIKTKQDIQKVLIVLQISNNVKNIETAKSTNLFYAKLLLEHGNEIKLYN
jgi:hypothetical protein